MTDKFSEKDLKELEYKVTCINIENLELRNQLESLNKKLHQSEAFKSNFISNIRNEINNPLSGILGLSKSIHSIHASDLDKIRSMAALIHSEAFYLEFQIRNIIAAAELEAGEYVPQILNVDVCSLINELIASFKGEAQKKGIDIELITIESNIFFNTDPYKLQLILSNLIANAIEYGNHNSKVIIYCDLNENQLKVTVQDFGIGITKKESIEIFNRFNQLDSGSTKNHKGHGIGLSVSKAYAEILQGFIEVISDKGWSKFTINLREYDKIYINGFSKEGNDTFFDKEEKF